MPSQRTRVAGHKQPLSIGIDVGGTNVKLGLVRGAKILRQEMHPTAPLASSPQAMIKALVDWTRALQAASPGPVAGVGVGIPGLVRYPKGIVDSCVNLAGWKKIPLRATLSSKLRLPVQVDNDVNAMSLAEWLYGAGRGVENLLCLTLGTGVGGGLILGGKVYHSRLGPSAEVGHMPLARRGIACSCGGEACLERYVGNRDILKQVRRQLADGARSRLTQMLDGDLNRLTPELIDRACAQGDRFAQSVWAQAGEAIGLSLVQVVNLLSPDRIVIGGGIAKAGQWIFEPIRKTVRRRAMRGLEKVSIVRAKLGASAGLIGAALLVQETSRQKAVGRKQ
jgi:glucokinase